MRWLTHQSCIYHIPNDFKELDNGVCRLAGFDLDSTLILSANGDKYSKTATDWVWAYPGVPETLRRLHEDGWTIAIFSNRKGAPWMHKKAQEKLEAIMKKLGFEVWVFFATKDDEYRKPNNGMMTLFIESAGITQWTDDSFYCGDAAGSTSPDKWHRWGDADIGFALNSEIPFKEPQDVFGNFPIPPIQEGTNLIITMGQQLSGWEAFAEYKDEHLVYDEGKLERKYVIVDDLVDVVAAEDEIVVVYGAHPTKAQREALRKRYTQLYKKPANSIVYWYARTSSDETAIDPDYIKQFQAPIMEKGYFRIN